MKPTAWAHLPNAAARVSPSWWKASSDEAWDTVKSTPWDAIAALIADDTCAWMLDASPQTLQTLVQLEPTNYAAVLMLAYSFYNTKG